MPVIAQSTPENTQVRVSAPTVDARLIAGIENRVSVPLAGTPESGDAAIQIRLGDAKVTFSRNTLTKAFSRWISMKSPLQALSANDYNEEDVWCTVHEKCDELDQIRHSVVFKNYTLEPDKADIFVKELLVAIKSVPGAVLGVEPTANSTNNSDTPAKLVIADYHFPKRKDGVIGFLLLYEDKILATHWEGYMR